MNKRKKKTGFWLLLATAVALASCNSDADLPEKAAGQASGPTIIPYSVTAGGEQTRAALNESDQLIFQSGDQLAVTGENISGILTLAEGANERTAKFSGELTYTGSGDAPADDLELTATLTGSADTQTGIASTFADAFSKYSLMQGTSTYGEGVFHLEQQTSFVVFTVKFTDGTAANTVFNVSITHNGGTEVAKGTTTTTTVGSDIVATFTLALPGGTKLTEAKATLTVDGESQELSFGGSSFTAVRNKYYSAVRTLEPKAPEAVDIGLSVKWANKNIGASKVTDLGLYFMWGDTEGHGSKSYGSNFGWTNYKYANGAIDKLTKYCNREDYGDDGYTDDFKTLIPTDDAATVNWGAGWRMPTREELEELVDTRAKTLAYTWEWKEKYYGSKTNGYLITCLANGNSIFMPAAASYSDIGNLGTVGEDCSYWSSTLAWLVFNDADNPGYASPEWAWAAYFGAQYSYTERKYNYYGSVWCEENRCDGLTIRPVKVGD